MAGLRAVGDELGLHLCFESGKCSQSNKQFLTVETAKFGINLFR